MKNIEQEETRIPLRLHFTRIPGYMKNSYSQKEIERFVNIMENCGIKSNIDLLNLFVSYYELDSKIIGNYFMKWVNELLLFTPDNGSFVEMLTADVMLLTLDPTGKKVISSQTLKQITPIVSIKNLYKIDKSSGLVTINLQFIGIENNNDILEAQKYIDKTWEEYDKKGDTIDLYRFFSSELDYITPLVIKNIKKEKE